ncbi:uncharacterized protein LOC111114432 [Crassostrea virginica]
MQACQTGWKGNRCIRECDGGFFGHNCTELCGECFEKERCHHVNGSCLKGCAYGYSGINCTNNEGIDVTKNRYYIAVVMITAAATITIFICGLICKRMHTLKRKADVNLASLQEYEMETHVVTNGYRGSTFPNNHAYVNVNGMWDLPAAIEQSEFDIQEDISDRLDQSEDSSILSTENALKDNPFHVTFITDVQMHELHTDIGANGSGLIGEFESLPFGEHQPCYVGKRQEHISKNRYKSIFPYDHSRVILKASIDNSDYINANYIKDSDEKIAYIATQGPKNSTINDFWQMVWQENVTQIVMLTNLMEDDKVRHVINLSLLVFLLLNQVISKNDNRFEINTF